jgi:hypothetical protein
MRDEDKPFVLYRKGPMNFTIVPRGTKGWVQSIIWMALLVPLLLWFIDYIAKHSEGPAFTIGLALYLGGMLVWTVGGIWWMKARAEVVDLQELLKLKRELDRKKRGGH